MRKYIGKLDDYITVLSALGAYLVVQSAQASAGNPFPPFFSMLISAMLGTLAALLLKGYLWAPLKVAIDWTDEYGAPQGSVILHAGGNGTICSLTVGCGPKSLAAWSALRVYGQNEPIWLRLNVRPGDQLTMGTESAHAGRPKPRIDRDGIAIYLGALREGESLTFNRFHVDTAGRPGAVRCAIKPLILKESQLDSWEAPGIGARLCNLIVSTSSSLSTIDVKN